MKIGLALWRGVFGLLLVLGPLAVAAVPMAPQAFRQEVAIRLALPDGLAPGGFTRVVCGEDGRVRATDGQAWYEVREGRVERLSEEAPWEWRAPWRAWQGGRCLRARVAREV
ncbi:MAG: hypothetical protein M5U12_07360 [Verrucomicrobia bacterium]|nr:hypothetical protein [Verrucomicrobiota bacterium]